MQNLFAQALLDPHAQSPSLTNAAGGRFNVYRNNYLITLRNVLRTTFPAVVRLVGEEFFAALACAFAERHPPRSPIMARYGGTFPEFLGQFAALADFPYLADVARLEYARVQAYHAADAIGFDLVSEASATAALDQPASLHPSVCIVASAHPVHSIWRAQAGEHDFAQPDGAAETVVIWRHSALSVVETMQIDAREHDLLAHFTNGGSFVALLANCMDQQAATFLITRFLELASAGILVPATIPDLGDNQ